MAIHFYAFRYVICAWMLVSFIVISGYSGTLRAFLISPLVEKPVETMDDVITQTQYPWDYLIYGPVLFADDPDPVVQDFWSGAEKLVFPAPLSPYDRVYS